MLFLTLPGALIAILTYDRAPQPLFQITLVLTNKIESKLLQIKGTHLTILRPHGKLINIPPPLSLSCQPPVDELVSELANERTTWKTMISNSEHFWTNYWLPSGGAEPFPVGSIYMASFNFYSCIFWTTSSADCCFRLNHISGPVPCL